MSITLPPLPVPAITMKHGPWKPSQFDDDETYCAHCLTRSIFAHSRRCDPRIDPESLRARDLEVARVVLKAAAQACREYPEPEAHAWAYRFGQYVSALEVRHHE
jgi:hypothetical protein